MGLDARRAEPRGPTSLGLAGSPMEGIESGSMPGPMGPDVTRHLTEGSDALDCSANKIRLPFRMRLLRAFQDA
jgi:hypothetical protein